MMKRNQLTVLAMLAVVLGLSACPSSEPAPSEGATFKKLGEEVVAFTTEAAKPIVQLAQDNPEYATAAGLAAASVGVMAVSHVWQAVVNVANWVGTAAPYGLGVAAAIAGGKLAYDNRDAIIAGGKSAMNAGMSYVQSALETTKNAVTSGVQVAVNNPGVQVAVNNPWYSALVVAEVASGVTMAVNSPARVAAAADAAYYRAYVHADYWYELGLGRRSGPIAKAASDAVINRGNMMRRAGSLMAAGAAVGALAKATYDNFDTISDWANAKAGNLVEWIASFRSVPAGAVASIQ